MGIENRKRSRLVLISFFIWLCLLWIVTKYWLFNIVPYEPWLARLSLISAGIWWVVLLWAIHHLGFQVMAILFPPKTQEPKLKKAGEKNLRIAILYPTCDDFVESAIESCLSQNYGDFFVYICDDSANEEYRRRIDVFVTKHSKKCGIIRRETRTGYKAGNVNNAIRYHVQESWFCLVDADQHLPPDYLNRIVQSVPQNAPRMAYLQATNDARDSENQSHFQTNMKDEITLYYSRDLAVRNRYGFLPLLGHGALIRKAAFLDLGGFPEVVSEDFSFALKAAAKSYLSHFAGEAKSYEAYPYDFGSFMIRIKKFSGGTAEIVRKSLFPFLLSKASLVEKWDFLIMIAWYFLVPLVMINGFLGAYVTHRYWQNEIPYIHPILPYLYTLTLFILFSVILSLDRKTFMGSVKFYFWTTAIYSASIPMVAWSFLKGLFKRPRFHRTPKSSAKVPLKKSDSVVTVFCGILALTAAIIWWSPFSWFFLGHAVSYLFFPLFNQINGKNALSLLVNKLLIYWPGSLMIIALIAIWHYAK